MHNLVLLLTQEDQQYSHTIFSTNDLLQVFGLMLKASHPSTQISKAKYLLVLKVENLMISEFEVETFTDGVPTHLCTASQLSVSLEIF